MKKKDSRGSTESLSPGTQLSAFAGLGLIRALARTWRYKTIGDESVIRFRKDKTPILFTLWHGQMLPLLWHHRDEGIAVLVSEHKDGEVIARILEWLGYALIRGSTSRGANRALLGIIRTLRDGHDVAVTPDGPRGPRHKFAPGSVIAANRAEVPILPIVAHVDRFWQLSTWDEFIIPKPFAKITVAYGTPTRVSADSPRDAADAAPRLEQVMEEAQLLACT